jgi:flagellar basal-body rod protein FlgC
MEISASGLTLQRKKMDTVAQNIANAETTRTKEGGPYRRRRVMVSAAEENIPFRNMVSQAATTLARTHEKHLAGRIRYKGDEVEISKVKGSEVEDPASSFRLVYDPGHPEADADGFVKMPDVEIINEMVDMMAASRAYEANTSAILSTKEMAKDALEI